MSSNLRRLIKQAPLFTKLRLSQGTSPVKNHVSFRPAVAKGFSLALTLATLILVVVVTQFNSWGHVFFSFFRRFQTLGLINLIIKG